MKMEILLEPTSNKLTVDINVLERFYTTARNPVKDILLKLNLPDHRKTLRWRSNEVLKLKSFKKNALKRRFKLTNQERYEHVGPRNAQDGKVYKMAKRDYAWLMISRR
nr:hypothetical protein [Tanacetum cinerariifolium]